MLTEISLDNFRRRLFQPLGNDLDSFQKRQADTKCASADETVDSRISETWALSSLATMLLAVFVCRRAGWRTAAGLTPLRRLQMRWLPALRPR